MSGKKFHLKNFVTPHLPLAKLFLPVDNIYICLIFFENVKIAVFFGHNLKTLSHRELIGLIILWPTSECITTP